MASRQICAYCGTREATTIDHVPPKSIFPKPRPHNLVTVPACFRCNNESSADDEEFRVFISITAGHETPKTNDLWRSGLIPTLRHNQRLRSSTLSRSRDVDVRTPGGIFLGRLRAIPLRADPHKRVLRRIVRGLYYHHFGQIVETETVVDANPMRKLPAEFAEFLPDMVLANVGGDAFIYRYGRAMESPQDSLWVLWFYRRHLVCGHTQTQERRTHTFDTDATPAALRVRSRVTG